MGKISRRDFLKGAAATTAGALEHLLAVHQRKKSRLKLVLLKK